MEQGLMAKDPEVKDPDPARAKAAADKPAVIPPDVRPAEKEVAWAAAVNRLEVRNRLPDEVMPAGGRKKLTRTNNE